MPLDVFVQVQLISGFLCGSAGKQSTCSVGDLGSIPGLGRSPGEGKGYPLQYSGLENPMDYTAHAIAKRRTRLSDFMLKKVTTTKRVTQEKAMAPHSSTLAWKIPWTEEPGRLQSMGSLRVGHN